MAKFPTFPTLFDGVKRISISNLKKWGYLENSEGGIITWHTGNVLTSYMGIFVNMRSEPPYVELIYTINDEPINYRISLVRIPSNLGKGFVWYFLCPHTQNRCRVLYQIGKYFLHRKALSKGMYQCQTLSKKWRESKKIFDVIGGAEEFLKAITQKHFRGSYKDKPTKRFLKLKKKHEQYLSLTEEDIKCMFGR